MDAFTEDVLLLLFYHPQEIYQIVTYLWGLFTRVMVHLDRTIEIKSLVEHFFVNLMYHAKPVSKLTIAIMVAMASLLDLSHKI